MSFYYSNEIYNTKAASQVVPIIIDLFEPKSVIDVGCGIGSWLKVFEYYKVSDYLGIDSSNIDKNKLLIDPIRYQEVNLEKNINVNRKFDLSICLEVAEHLTENRAKDFVSELTNLSPIIIFSAALPFQGGQNHINEQYPQYWIDLFKLNDFDCYDIIRPLIWNNELVDWWYRQNILVFMNKPNPTLFKPTLVINPLISHELYNNKITQIQELELNISTIINSGKGIKFYIYNLLKVIIKRLINPTKKIK